MRVGRSPGGCALNFTGGEGSFPAPAILLTPQQSLPHSSGPQRGLPRAVWIWFSFSGLKPATFPPPPATTTMYSLALNEESQVFIYSTRI